MTTQVIHTAHNMATHPDLPGVEVYLLEVTPALAHELLELNISGQRSLSQAAVERYATDMSTYDWIFNGAAILISNENKLIDGQHRLNAIAESGVSQVLLIVRGVSTEAMQTVDTNRRRSYADTLKMKKIKNHTVVAALNTRVWYWFHGNYGTRGVGRIANPQHLSATPSNAQKDFWMNKIQDAYGVTMEAAAAHGVKAYAARPGISSSTYALAWVIMSGIDKDLREGFFHEFLVESAFPNTGYPIVALTNRLARLKKRETLDHVEQLDAIWTTYNNWVKNTKIDTIVRPRLYRHDILEMPHGYTELGN